MLTFTDTEMPDYIWNYLVCAFRPQQGTSGKCFLAILLCIVIYFLIGLNFGVLKWLKPLTYFLYTLLINKDQMLKRMLVFCTKLSYFSVAI